MQTPDDSSQCLRQFATRRSEEDFRQLVEAYSGLVFAVARRKLNGSETQAAEVAQQVFTELAQRAPTLPVNIILGAWLHRVTCNRAALLVRTETRRRKYEAEAAAAAMMSADSTFAETAVWTELAPVLDDELNRLSAGDRAALVLRFYEKQGIRDVGERLGTTEEGARKRIARALEKLRTRFARRGLVAPVVPLLGTFLIQRAAEAGTVPAGFVRTLTHHALQAGPLHWWIRAWPGVASALAGAVSVLAVAAVPLWRQEASRTSSSAPPSAVNSPVKPPGPPPFVRQIAALPTVEEGLTLEQIVQRIAILLRARSSDLRYYRLRALAAMIPASDAAAALRLLAKEFPGAIAAQHVFTEELHSILSNAAESDPDGTMVWVKQHLTGEFRVRTMRNLLAPPITVAELQRHLPELLAKDVNGDEVKDVIKLLRQSVMELPFEEAARHLIKTAREFDSGLPMSALMDLLNGDGKPRPLADWQTAWPLLAELPGPAWRRAAREAFVQSRNSLDSAGTRQWLDTLPPEEKQLFAPQTVTFPVDPKTGKTDPAIDWTPDIDWLHKVSPQAMPQFLSRWYGHSPEQLQGWLEKHPDQVLPTLDLDQGRLFRHLSIMYSEQYGSTESQIAAAVAKLRPLVQILQRHDPAAVKMLDKEIAIPEQAEILRRCLLP